MLSTSIFLFPEIQSFVFYVLSELTLPTDDNLCPHCRIKEAQYNGEYSKETTIFHLENGFDESFPKISDLTKELELIVKGTVNDPRFEARVAHTREFYPNIFGFFEISEKLEPREIFDSPNSEWLWRDM